MSQKGKGVRMFRENGLSFFALYLLTDDPKMSEGVRMYRKGFWSLFVCDDPKRCPYGRKADEFPC